MKKRFKKGDRVRYIGNGEFEEFLFSCDKGDEFIVTEANENEVIIDLGYYQTFDNKDLELVSRPSENPKTAFLTELKELMERYQAEFGDYEGYRVHFKIGNEYVGWDTSEGEITPSNIFDYDKV